MTQRKTVTRNAERGVGHCRSIGSKVFINDQYLTCTTGFVVTREGVVLIDTPLVPQQARDWREQIMEKGRKEKNKEASIEYIILTDHHRGHALGCQHFMPAKVIGHERAHKEMQGYTENFRERVRNSYRRDPEIQEQLQHIEIIPPHMTFSKEAVLNMGDTTIRCIHVGGHTPATCIVWLEEEGICFVGDTIWTDQHPYMAQANSKEWLEALTLIQKFNPDVIVPGHGDLCTVQDIKQLASYISQMRDGINRCLDKGLERAETKKELTQEMVALFDVPASRKSRIESQINSGINRVYRELQRERQAQSRMAA